VASSEIRHSKTAAQAAPREPRVAWIGRRPAALEGIDLPTDRDRTTADVVHLVLGDLGIRDLRRDAPEARIVLHVPGETTAGGRAAAREAALANLVVVETAAQVRDLTRRKPELEQRLRVLRRPLDLEFHAPEAQLLEAALRGRSLRRFRRFHRLVSPIVLFAGPYTDAGGLDMALEAVFRLRETTAETRLAAIPVGDVDAAYLDRIERRALALGHHAVVEWSVVPEEVPFWYAVADVVCAPCRIPLDVPSAGMAAAAGRPWVGSDFAPARAYQDDAAAILVAPGDLDALSEALGTHVRDLDQARRLGEGARRQAERELTPEGVSAQLRRLWQEAQAVAPATVAEAGRGGGLGRLLPLKSPAN
jgi:glycosyltransferase involved in cell wall biosynthesis